MPYEIKIIFLPEPLLPGALHLPLQLDDILAQDEPGFKEAHQHPGCYRHEVLVPPGIAHEHCAVLTRLQNAHALKCDLPHLLRELSYIVHARQVALDAVAGVGDDACIGRMGGDEVDGLALNQVKRARIADVSLNLRRHIISIQRRIREVQPVARHHDGIGIDVHSHGAPSQKLALHNRSARASHLVKHKVARRSVAQDEVARDVRRPVAPVVADVGRPVAAVGERPDCGGFGGEGGGGKLWRVHRKGVYCFLRIIRFSLFFLVLISPIVIAISIMAEILSELY